MMWFGKKEKEERLISKRELLARYGISYGALYRWKRMGLIPEEWFLKQATQTGQETFFPEKLITERVEKILSSKDTASLESLAAEFSGVQKAETYLTLETVFGEKKYRREDLRAVYITDGEQREDLINILDKYFQKIGRTAGKKGENHGN